MPDYKTNPLEQFNNNSVYGTNFSADDKRRPKQISQVASGPYNVSQLSYPTDITNAPDLQHYVVFYINVRGKTKFKPQRKVDVDVSTAGQNILSAKRKINTGVAQATLTAAAAGAAASRDLIEKTAFGQRATNTLQNLTQRGSPASRTRLAIGALQAGAGLAAGAATAAAGAALIGISDTLGADEPARISDAIILPIDSIPRVSYGMTYDEYESGIIGGIMGGSSAIETGGVASEAGLRAALAIADLGKQFAGIGNAKQNILSASAVQTNPFREVYFKAINFRNFSFNYTFLPKSEEEVYNVKRIVDMFKFHMHPELSEGGLFYVYPSEFEIAYYYKGQENQFIHRISTCVLTSMNVDYGSQFFTSFDNGAPTEIKLALNFRELELLTKERIVKGY